ncbi:MAG: OmpH family outer membrane protein [Magnetospirillum sp.]|nr:OmpH family outer membrane protein [Magnetospirillum sp.]
MRLGAGVGAVLLLLSLCGAPVADAAETAPSNAPLPQSVIIVVDPQAAMQQSKAGQAIRVEHDKYRQKYQTEFETIRKSLTEDGNDLAKQKPVMKQEIWQKKARAFDQRVYEFNQRYQSANLAVEKSYREAMGELGQAFADVTAEVANEVGANLVLPIQQVVLHDPRMDMTKAVIERMNRKYPSVTFPVPVIKADSAAADPDPAAAPYSGAAGAQAAPKERKN